MNTTQNPNTSPDTREAEVMQLLQPLDPKGVGAVFENRVDNAGVAAVIVQRQKAELRAKQEAANEQLENVLKPALKAAVTARLAALSAAMNVLLPKVQQRAEDLFRGLAVAPYSSVSVGLTLAGIEHSPSDEGGAYKCTDASNFLNSFDVYAKLAITWGGKSFLDKVPVLAFPESETDFVGLGPAPTVTGAAKDVTGAVMALAKFAFPQHVLDAIATEKAAQAAYNSVASYIMDIRRALQNADELHEQALARLSEMSLKQTAGGEALLASITDHVRLSFAPKAPAALQIGAKT